MESLNESFAEHIRERVAVEIEEWDPGAQVTAAAGHAGLVELCIVSDRFEGLGSAERESAVWSSLREALPRDMLVRTTYSLMLTPQEATEFFAAGQRRSERNAFESDSEGDAGSRRGAA